MEEKEKRVRTITNLYYSNPNVQTALVKFSECREVVPRYFEIFGKRPDSIQYASDIIGLVKRGATSFHASEEIWTDPLQISAEMGINEFNSLRKSWDLLIDIDSPFLDCSKIATELIIAALEKHGLFNYGIKFSGSKGFHIIVSGKAFPKEYAGMKMKEMFPEWPRIISRYLMRYIRSEYNNRAAEILTNFKAIEQRTKISQEELKEVHCLICESVAEKGKIVRFRCPVCRLTMERRDIPITKRRLRCVNAQCAGVLEIDKQIEYYRCPSCKDPSFDKIQLSSDKYPSLFEQEKGVSAEKVAALDLVLVAPRHLFRMPYSLHEKTALASVVLKKEQIFSFEPKEADPLKVKVIEFLPENREEEAIKLLLAALDWNREEENVIESKDKKHSGEYASVDISNISEDMFPPPIKKLLKGLADGKKRGLFILITFLKSLNFPLEYVERRISEWNKLNSPPLKEGYVKSQLEWHFRQKKKILPPNYDNAAFYKDLNLIEKKPNVKNPIVEVIIAARRQSR